MNRDYYSYIGKRIREKRRSLGLTQEELCKGHITRNMLSLIENGDARPSLDTLLYIAERLNMPPAFFLCRNEDEASQYENAQTRSQIRKLTESKRYDKINTEAGDAEDDEICFAAAVGEAKCAVRALRRSGTDAVLSHLDKAAEALSHTVYLGEELKKEIDLLYDICAYIKSGTLPPPESISSCSAVITGGEFHTFLLAVSLCEYADSSALMLMKMLPEGSPSRGCLAAKQLINEKKYTEALVYLQKVIEQKPDLFTLSLALKDAEHCYYMTGNYKEAYDMSKRRSQI